MSFFAPDDFSDDPYQAANNQSGHKFLGAALVSLMPVTLYALPSVFAAGFIAFLWEFSQRRWRGATKADYFIDLIYWCSGVGFWAAAIHSGLVTGWAIYAPWLLVLTWCIVLVTH